MVRNQIFSLAFSILRVPVIKRFQVAEGFSGRDFFMRVTADEKEKSSMISKWFIGSCCTIGLPRLIAWISISGE